MLFQTVYYLIAALSFAVTCAYYIINLRNTQKSTQLTLETRQTQLFMQVMDKMDTDFMTSLWAMLYEWKWSDFDDFMKRYGPVVNTNFVKVFTLMEHIGILAEEGLLDPKLIFYFMGDYPQLLWITYKGVILEWRERFEKPPKGRFLEFFEFGFSDGRCEEKGYVGV